MGVDSAIDELTRALSYLLPPAGWAEVAQVLDQVEAASRRGDQAAAVAAARELVVFGGTRTRIGDPPTGPVPEQIRERVNRLVHDLSEQSVRSRLAEERDARRGGQRGGDGEDDRDADR